MVIGICDDEIGARSLIETYIRKVAEVETIYHFGNGDEVLAAIRQGKKLDILFLDIDLKGSPDGMEVAEKIKGRQIKEGTAASALPIIIFITGLPERMPEAFGVRAFQYIVKPINEKQFDIVLEQAMKAAFLAPKLRSNKQISVTVGNSKKTITLSEIIYIESAGRKMIIHLRDRTVEFYGTMADITKDLDKSFFQPHRSFIVNMNHTLRHKDRGRKGMAV